MSSIWFLILDWKYECQRGKYPIILNDVDFKSNNTSPEVFNNQQHPVYYANKGSIDSKCETIHTKTINGPFCDSSINEQNNYIPNNNQRQSLTYRSLVCLQSLTYRSLVCL